MLAVTAARIRKALLQLEFEVRVYTSTVVKLQKKHDKYLRQLVTSSKGERKVRVVDAINYKYYVPFSGDPGYFGDADGTYRAFYSSDAMSHINGDDNDRLLMPLKGVKDKFTSKLEALRAVTPIKPKKLVYILGEYERFYGSEHGVDIHCSIMLQGTYRAVSAFRAVPKGDDMIRSYTVNGASSADCENCTDCADCGGCDGCQDCSNCNDCDTKSETGIEGKFSTSLVLIWLGGWGQGAFSDLEWEQKYIYTRDNTYHNTRIPLTDGNTYDTWLPYYGDAVATESVRVSTGDDNHSCGGGSGYRGTAGEYNCLLKSDSDSELVSKYNKAKPSAGSLSSGYGVVVGSDDTVDRLKNADGYTPISDDGYYINILVSECNGWDGLPNASKTVR